MAHPLISRFFDVITAHRKILNLPGSVTGRLTAQWAKIMVFPQVLAPVLIVFGVPAVDVLLIFAARFAAMHIVWLLDHYTPYARALGLCHLVTFGPLFVYFSLEFTAIQANWGSLGSVFVFYYAVIAACLYMDLRDLVLHMVGQPYPAYMRDHHRNGHVTIDDPRVEEPVTVFNRVLW
ncbi:MAG: hypothetical protein P8L68_01025 [Paracoccaceae bacterium]|nr:hypothetical protein [Paracoccaceae bacterium]MDG2257064.1 hypothetical protein [Paracoccaceae bacterium]